MLCGRVPIGFHKSYIVPIPKIKDTRTKALTCDDFRGIAISPVISKVFEYYIVDRFSKFLSSSESDNQFGFKFKKSLSCSHAIYSTRLIVDSFAKAGNTANLCLLICQKHLTRLLITAYIVSIFFGAVLPSVLVLRKVGKLALRYQCLDNAFCTHCRSI